MPDGLPRASHNKKTIGARSYRKEFNRKPGRPSFWRKIKRFHFAISAKAIILVPKKHTRIFAKLSIYKMIKKIILVPKKHTRIFAKLSIYKMYYIKKMPHGLPRASHNKKTVGSPKLHKRIQ